MAGRGAGLGRVLVTMVTSGSLAVAGPQIQFPGVPAVPLAPLLTAQTAGRCGGRQPANETLAEVMEEYFQWKLATYPEWATLEGFPGYNHLVEDFSKEAILDKGARCQQFLERGCLLEPEGGPEARHWDVFQTEVLLMLLMLLVVMMVVVVVEVGVVGVMVVVLVGGGGYRGVTYNVNSGANLC